MAVGSDLKEGLKAVGMHLGNKRAEYACHNYIITQLVMSSGHSFLYPSQTLSKQLCKVYLGGLPAAVSKGDIREALHCFGATSVIHY